MNDQHEYVKKLEEEMRNHLLNHMTEITVLKAEMKGVRRIAHKHFWMGD